MDAASSLLEDHYAALEKHVQKSEFKKIVKKADEILKISPEEVEAFKCKIVALIQVGSYDEVLQTLSKARGGEEFQLEKAYCLYKNGKHDEALDKLRTIPDSSPKFELQAQIYYRMGRHEECIACYESISGLVGPQGLSEEMKSNMVAAYVGADRSSDVNALISTLQLSPKDSFDLAYNVACAYADQGKWKEAEDMLLIARRLGQETLIDEDLSEQEVYDELAPITVQLAYVQHMAGKQSEAVESYLEILKRKPADAPSVAVACNNLVALRGAHQTLLQQGQSKDLFDSVKRMEKLFGDRKAGSGAVPMDSVGNLFPSDLEDRLSVKQKRILALNYLSLLIHSNRLDQAQKLLPSTEGLIPPDWYAIVEASILVKSKRVQDALLSLTAHLASSSESTHSTPFLLTFAHVALLCGNLGEASKALMFLEPELQLKPALVATLVDLQERENNLAGAEACLDKALSVFGTTSGTGGSSRSSSWDSLLLASAALKVKHGKAGEAAALYRRFLEGSRSTGDAVQAEAVMGLVECLAVAMDRPDEAERYEEQMVVIPGASSVDVEALLQAASVGFSSGSGAVKGKRAGAADDKEAGKEQREKKRRKKRKVILPKGFDPANPGPLPDPERWLPKRERSTYKPRKKDKRSGAHLRGAQGSVSQDPSAEIGGVGPKGGKGVPAGGKGGKGPAGVPPKVEGVPAFGAKKRGKKGRK